MQKEITVGAIVLYQGGWYRVRRVTRNWVNLGSIFGRTLYHKSVPREQVKEDEENWYRAWRNTESYQCM